MTSRPKNDLSEAWRLVALGVDEPIRRVLTQFCERDPAVSFAGVTSSVTTLLFALEETRPELAVIDERSLGQGWLSTLSSLHQASPRTCMLVVGERLEATEHRLKVLRFGVRGLLTRARAATELKRAIEAVRRGEIWLSRTQASQLLIQLTAEEIRRHSQVASVAGLTPQQNKVLQQCLVGQSNKEIARALGITEQTVKIHLQHIFQKLRVRRRADLLLRRWAECDERADQDDTGTFAMPATKSTAPVISAQSGSSDPKRGR